MSNKDLRCRCCPSLNVIRVGRSMLCVSPHSWSKRALSECNSDLPAVVPTSAVSVAAEPRANPQSLAPAATSISPTACEAATCPPELESLVCALEAGWICDSPLFADALPTGLLACKLGESNSCGGSSADVPAQMQGSSDCGLARDDVKPGDTMQGSRPACPVTCPQDSVSPAMATPGTVVGATPPKTAGALDASGAPDLSSVEQVAADFTAGLLARFPGTIIERLVVSGVEIDREFLSRCSRNTATFRADAANLIQVSAGSDISFSIPTT